MLFIAGLVFPAIFSNADEAGDDAPPRLLEWPMLPGESLRRLAQLVYPHDPAMQGHFIEAAIHGNPATFTGFGADDIFERETLIWLPDLKQLSNLAAAPGRPRHDVRTPLPAMQPGAKGARPGRLQLSPRLEPSTGTQPQPESSGAGVRLTYAGQIRHTNPAPATGPAARSAIHALIAHNEALKAEQARLEARIAALEAGVAEARTAIVRMQQRSAAPVRLPSRPPVAQVAAPSPATESLLSPMPFHLFSAIAVVVAGVTVVWVRRRQHRPRPPLSVTPVTMPPLPQSRMEVESMAQSVVTDTAPRAPPPDKSRTADGVMTVDEIDSVVEEAKVFVALGRTERAIEMLEEYIAAHPRASASPWLYLLELYRSLNRRDEFTALAKRFHQSLNVIAPQWEATSQAMMVVPRSLTEFPHIMTRLCATWGTLDAQDFLNHLLQDNRGGERQGFSMEVLQEILLLLAILDLRDTLPELKPF